MYTLEDVYKTFPSGCTEDYKIRRAFEMGKQTRERQIEIDAEQIRALQKQKGELTDELTKKSDTNHQLVEQLAKLNERCSELEAQIEKMKCCYNCSKWNDGQCADIPNSSYYSADFVCEDWEMKENE